MAKAKWKAPTCQCSFYISISARNYLDIGAEKFDVSRSLYLNCLLLRLAAKNKFIPPIPLSKDRKELIAESLKQMTPDEKRKARKNAYAEVRRNRYGRRFSHKLSRF